MHCINTTTITCIYNGVRLYVLSNQSDNLLKLTSTNGFCFVCYIKFSYTSVLYPFISLLLLSLYYLYYHFLNDVIVQQTFAGLSVCFATFRHPLPQIRTRSRTGTCTSIQHIQPHPQSEKLLYSFHY